MKKLLFILFIASIVSGCNKTNDVTPVAPQIYLHLKVTGVLSGTTWSIKIVDQTGKIDYNAVSQTTNQETDIAVNSKDVLMVTSSITIKTFVYESFSADFSSGGTPLKSFGEVDGATGVEKTTTGSISITMP